MAKSAMKRDQQKFTLLLLLPALLTIIIFTSLPALTTLSYSFFHWTGFQRGSFAGIENFRRLFAFPFRDSLFMAMRHNTLVFIGILIIQTSLGILIAYALYRLKRGQRFFRTVIFLPVIFSLVIVGYMWQAMLDPFYGPINYLLHKVGWDSLALTWLGSTATALPTLVFINLWRWVGFPAIIFLAGLNAINSEYLEAAKIDGASESQIFRKIMFPLLAPSMTIVTVLTFIGAFEWFDLPYVLGGSSGSPAGATDTLALMFYRLSFGSVDSGANEIGIGAALGVLIFTVVGIGAGFGSKYLRSREVQM
ncbi:MAG: sugar ABC transporter permease [Actinobacteria bacterium]|jgi:raffinose/stachyose/melibiose transport system permease protein|nr:sugar ABC transporter permease [Actinomycetota bacterium]NDH12503.1 sugar ABC transporter permease [Actinomycetota bacterium]TRZ84109.1 MAG: sugar ABC transporter permease [Streptomycetaceae bacterium]